MDSHFSSDVIRDARAGENLILAVIMGVVASVAGSLVWMGLSLGYEVGAEYLVLLTGLIVGLTVRLAGHGAGFIFGLLAMVLTFLGSLVGEVLSVIESGTHDKLDFYGVLSHLNLFDVIESIYEHTEMPVYLFGGLSLVMAFIIARQAR